MRLDFMHIRKIPESVAMARSFAFWLCETFIEEKGDFPFVIAAKYPCMQVTIAIYLRYTDDLRAVNVVFKQPVLR